jgi:hypothetical protein
MASKVDEVEAAAVADLTHSEAPHSVPLVVEIHGVGKHSA